jgi:hypothetical protein
MKTATAFAILCLVFAASCAAQSLPEAAMPPIVQVRLSLLKSTFKVGEPLEMTAIVKNEGSEPFYIWNHLFSGYYGEGILVPHLTDSAGKDVPEKFRLGSHTYQAGLMDFAEYVENRWLWLAPGQFYGVTENRFKERLEPGTYSLSVEYSSSVFPWLYAGKKMADVQESAKKLKHAALIGKFMSNEVTFTVVKSP